MASQTIPEASKNQSEVYHQWRTDSDLHIQLLELISLPEGSKVLDLGCGTGEITYKLAEKAGSKSQIIGVDPDKDRLEIAKGNNKFPNLTFVEGDSATFPEEQYDLIYCQYVTHWVKDKETMFKKVYKSLKSGGKFAIVAILQQSSLAQELIELMGPHEKRKIDAETFFFCTVEKYDQLALENGFTTNLKEEGIDVYKLSDPETTIQVWEGISTGMFDPKKVDKEGLEKFRQKYKGKKMEWKVPVVRCILTRN